jgi:CxxC motif-containing protein (DUF1111 family)
LVAIACTPAPLGYEPGEDRAGGELGTTVTTSQDAYTQPMPGLTFDQVGDFEVGNSFDADDWVVAPSSTDGRDGLGPLYNATSCSACHSRDGRGQPPADGMEMLSMLVRLSVPGTDAHGGPLGEPTYGGQFQPRAIPGIPSEGSSHIVWTETPGTYADGTSFSLRAPTITLDGSYGPMAPGTLFSARVAPPQFGLGLLEEIDEADILAHADPEDADHDGISGRPNRVWDQVAGAMALGRFGWKANQPSLRQQTAGAMLGDIGMTSSLDPDQNCTAAEMSCAAAPDGGDPELSDMILDLLVFYGRTLAVPARRDVGDATVLRGRALFRDAGCADCHVPSFTTGASDVPVLDHQHIWPYTDLLLHDMGEGLADHRPDYDATGTEWRTPPLWGIGLSMTVNRHEYLLHDGRARGLEEAILWHGGEAEAARDAFVQMSAADRAALVTFLRSL